MILVRLKQFLNADASMVMTLFGTTMFRRFEQASNTLGPRPVMVAPRLVAIAARSTDVSVPVLTEVSTPFVNV